MRNYDGKEYRYKSSDLLKKKGYIVLSDHLGFKPNKSGLDYDIKLYAGGTGVFDKLAASFKADEGIWNNLKERFELLNPIQAAESEFWSDDFNWLIDRETQAESPMSLAIEFINTNKLPFQIASTIDSSIYFVVWSDVNDWTVFWGNKERANFLSLNQG